MILYPITIPGGSDTQMQYNNGGIFGGAAVYYDDVNERMGIGNSSPTSLLDVGTGFSPSLYTIRTGSFIFQPFALNNSFVAENAFYNGSNWEYLNTGYAEGFQMRDGQMVFFGAASGTGGAAITQVNPLKVDYLGRVGLGGNISSSLGNFNAATLVITDEDLLHKNNTTMLHTMERADVVIMQFFGFNHDNAGFFFDAGFDSPSMSAGWRSGDAGSNFGMYKYQDVLKLVYDSGVAVDGAVSWNDGLVLATSGFIGFGGEKAPETLIELTHATPFSTLHNSTHEDTDGGRESRLNFKGEQSGGEETTLARIEASHDGAADDEKGKIVFSTNATADTDTPTTAMTIDSTQAVTTVKNKITPIGGIAILLTNTTGAVTVAGQLVKADTATDDAVILTAAGDVECFGVFLDSGVADDAEAWIVVAGIADVAMEDNTAATHGNWVETSDAEAGYADATSATPAAAPAHFEEIGHCIESVAAGGAGTHILARCVLHFN